MVSPKDERNRAASKAHHKARQRATARNVSPSLSPDLIQFVKVQHRAGAGRRTLLIDTREWALARGEKPPSMYSLRILLKAIENDGDAFDALVGDVLVRA